MGGRGMFIRLHPLSPSLPDTLNQRLVFHTLTASGTSVARGVVTQRDILQQRCRALPLARVRRGVSRDLLAVSQHCRRFLLRLGIGLSKLLLPPFQEHTRCFAHTRSK